MNKYIYDFKGIGGRIKTEASDFKVVEIDDSGVLVSSKSRLSHPCTSCSYVHFVANRKNLPHQLMLSEISKFFGVSQSDVSTAGIKDKKAEITQEIAVFNPQQNTDTTKVELIEGLQIRKIGSSVKGLPRGHITGNQFDILIRDVSNLDFEAPTDFKTLNYYGYQRFGCTSPSNFNVGINLLRGNYREALNYLIGAENYAEHEFRKVWQDTRDPEITLRSESFIPSIERNVLIKLNKTGDHKQAMLTIPRFLLNLFQRSVISLLWNNYLSIRSSTLDIKLLKGERKAKDSQQNNIEIALPSNKWKEPINKVWMELFQTHNLTVDMLKSFRHSTRLFYLYPEQFKSRKIDNNFQVIFRIPTGSYATVVLREIMRSGVKSLC